MHFDLDINYLKKFYIKKYLEIIRRLQLLIRNHISLIGRQCFDHPLFYVMILKLANKAENHYPQTIYFSLIIDKITQVRTKYQ